MLQIPIPDISRIDDKNNRVAGGVVGLPELAQRVLAADVPDLEVHVWENDGGDVLADGGDSFEVGGRGGGGAVGVEDGFYLLVKGGLACVVEAEEEEGVFFG